MIPGLIWLAKIALCKSQVKFVSDKLPDSMKHEAKLDPDFDELLAATFPSNNPGSYLSCCLCEMLC